VLVQRLRQRQHIRDSGTQGLRGIDPTSAPRLVRESGVPALRLQPTGHAAAGRRHTTESLSNTTDHRGPWWPVAHAHAQMHRIGSSASAHRHPHTHTPGPRNLCWWLVAGSSQVGALFASSLFLTPELVAGSRFHLLICFLNPNPLFETPTGGPAPARPRGHFVICTTKRRRTSGERQRMLFQNFTLATRHYKQLRCNRLALGARARSPVLVPSGMYQGTFANTNRVRGRLPAPPRWPPGPGFLGVERGRAA
jgi:hypothetical protein